MRELRFGQFRLDPARRELRRGSELLTLQPKAFDCIAYLAEHRDRAVGRDELIAAVWGRTEISDNVLDQVMLRARRTLGDTQGERRILRTVPRFGFAWIAPTEVVEIDDQAIVRLTVPETMPVDQALSAAPTALAPSPVAPPRRRASIALLALVIVLATTVALWLTLPQRSPSSTPEPVANLGLLLPVSIQADAQFAWARLGAMDLIANRLRGAGQPMLPSDNVVALAHELRGDDPDPAQLRSLVATSAAGTVFKARARRSGDAWRVTLQTIAGRDPPLFAEGEAHDLTEAAVAAADGMAGKLGLTPAALDSDLVSSPERALRGVLQQVEAAMLADQPDTARALLDGLDGDQRAHPEVRYRRAMVDFRSGRLDAAQAELETLRGITSTEDDALFHARVLNLLAGLALRRDDYRGGERQTDTVVALLAGAPPSPEFGRALMGRAISRSALSEFDAAMADFARARFTLESVGDQLGVVRVNANVGILEARRGRYAEALPLLEDAATRLSAFHDFNSELFVRVAATYAHLALLDPAAALPGEARMAMLIEREPNPQWKQYAALARVEALAANGKLADARVLLAGARQAAQRAGDAAILGSANVVAARMALTGGDAVTAVRLSGEVLATAWQAEQPREQASAYLTRVRAQLASADTAGAAVTATALAAWADSSALPVARLHAALADAARATAANEHDVARRAFEIALAQADATRVPADLLGVCVPYADWLIARDERVSAGAVAARVAAWADRDFDAAVLQVSVHHALHQVGPWRAAMERARALAGEREIPAELTLEPELRVSRTAPP